MMYTVFLWGQCCSRKQLLWFSKSKLSSETIPFMTGLWRNIGEGFAVVDSKSRILAWCKQGTVGKCFTVHLLPVPTWGHSQCRCSGPSWRRPWRMVQPQFWSCFRHGPGDSLLIVGCFIFLTTFMFWVSFLPVPVWCCCKAGLHQFPALCPPVVFYLSDCFPFPILHIIQKKTEITKTENCTNPVVPRKSNSIYLYTRELLKPII
jgi:hypothetical protein